MGGTFPLLQQSSDPVTKINKAPFELPEAG
jgi:hypothetical protein